MKYLCVAWRQQMARKNLKNDNNYNNNNDNNNNNNDGDYIQINSELHTNILVGKILIEKQNHTDVTMTHLMELCKPFL
jgi:hypothetical protein